MPPALSDDQAARREDLKKVVLVASLLLNHEDRWHRARGVAYFRLDELDFGRQESAALVGLGAKAVDWARNKYRPQADDVDPIAEFRDLMAPVLQALADMSVEDIRTLLGDDFVVRVQRDVEPVPA